MKIVWYWVVYSLVSWVILPINFLMRFKLDFLKVEQDDFAFINSYTEKDFEALDKDLSGEGQDQAKFYGMRYYATKDIEDWDTFYDKFVDEDSLLFSRGEGYNDIAFSGDMIVGVVIAVATAIQFNHISQHQMDILGKIFHKICFEGWLPFRQPNGNYDRGWLGLPCIVNGMGMTTVTLLKLCALTNGGIKRWYSYLSYYLYFIVSVPSFLFGTWDRCLWWWKICCFFTYSTHSDAVLYRGCELLNITFSRQALNYMYSTHGHYNIEIAEYCGYPHDKSTVLKHLARMAERRADYGNNVEKVTILDIKAFGFTTWFKYQPIGMKNFTYNHEKVCYEDRGSSGSQKSNFDIEGMYILTTRRQ